MRCSGFRSFDHRDTRSEGLGISIHQHNHESRARMSRKLQKLVARDWNRKAIRGQHASGAANYPCETANACNHQQAVQPQLQCGLCLEGALNLLVTQRHPGMDG